MTPAHPCTHPEMAGLELRDYFFGEISPADTALVRGHLAHCPGCVAELEALRATSAALRELPDEEVPRRIAFVSDRVFEPSPFVRGWKWFWASTARMGSLAAAMLAVAILIHAFRPAPAIQVVKQSPPTPAVVQTSWNDALVQARIDRAVAAASARSEARYDAKLKQVIAENERGKRETMERVAVVLDAMDRRNKVITVASNSLLEAGQ